MTSSRPQPAIAPLLKQSAWKALQEHHAKIKNVHLRQLFREDLRRGERFALGAAGLYFDYSKNRITSETMRSFSAGETSSEERRERSL
jgi:glucose-6-phosphate isomerase